MTPASAMSGLSVRTAPSEHDDFAATALDDDRVRSLTRAMCRGDRNAYAELFVARCDFLETVAARALRSRRDLAQDAAQDAWLRIARRPVACESVPELEAWLRRVAMSAAVDMIRSELTRRIREEQVARSRQEAGEFLSAAALLDALRTDLSALRSLDREDHALLELRARVDRSAAAIAGMIGIGTAALESRLRRATARARRIIEGGEASP